jgi:hypothetical protein
MASLDSLLKYAYRKVDERDGGVCIYPSCGSSYNTEHHHCEPRSQAKDRVACVENIVTLCIEHHHGNEGPHKSAYWREYWERWQRETYPYYITKAEQNEMERLKLKRFADPSVLERLRELEEKWDIWEKRKVKVV